MIRFARPLFLGGLMAAGLALAPGHAQAQTTYVYQPGRTVVVAPGAPAVVPGATYPAAPGRRFARRPGRYTAMRPAYSGRPAISFAPYSDRYLSQYNDRNLPNTLPPSTYLVPLRPR